MSFFLLQKNFNLLLEKKILKIRFSLSKFFVSLQPKIRLSLNYLRAHVEALIFCAQEPITLIDIAKSLKELLGEELPDKVILEHVSYLMSKYEDDQYAFGISSIAGGYQFLTKPAYEKTINILLNQTSRRRLSRTALETLAIIAYRQPITKTQVELLRGVGADYAIQKLLEKELIAVKGRAKTPGRPVLYGTSDKFMQYFGINSIDDLPLPEDFAPATPASVTTLKEGEDED